MDAEHGPLAIAFLGDPNSIHLRRWVGHFARRGHRVSLLLPTEQPVDPGLEPSIEVTRFEPYWRNPSRPVGAYAARRSLQNVLKTIAPDLLHAHYLTVHGWHARLSGFRPYAITLWGSDMLITAQVTVRGRLYARLSLQSADLVTADAAEVLRAAGRAGAPPDRLQLVQFGVDTMHFRPGTAPDGLRHELGLDGRRVVLSPRTIAPLYRHRVVLEALARLPADVALVMSRHAGWPAEIAAVEARAAELGMSDRIRIVPPRDHDAMADLYRLADVVVSVPASDATPVTLLEALAVGRPVVSSDLPSVREWLADLEPAWLVPVDDVAATASALRRVLEQPADEAVDLAARGRELVESRGSQAAAMARAEDLYRQVVRDRGRRRPTTD